MVVCDGAMVLNFVASAMLNGVCCMHSMNQDERRQQETREALRNVISVEYQRQRLIEIEEQERILRDKGLDAASVLADERRRLYIAAKVLASQTATSVSDRSQESTTPEFDLFVAQPVIRDRKSSQNTLPPSTKSRFVLEEPDTPRSPALEGRSRSAPTCKTKRISAHRIPLLVASPSSSASVTSSLFDSDSDDEFDVINLM